MGYIHTLVVHQPQLSLSPLFISPQSAAPLLKVWQWFFFFFLFFFQWTLPCWCWLALRTSFFLLHSFSLTTNENHTKNNSLVGRDKSSTIIFLFKGVNNITGFHIGTVRTSFYSLHKLPRSKAQPKIFFFHQLQLPNPIIRTKYLGTTAVLSTTW